MNEQTITPPLYSVESKSRSLQDMLSPDAPSPRLYFAIALAAALIGIAGSLLFRDAPGIGLNLTLGIALFFTGWYCISILTDVPRWRKICASLAVFYGLATALRASNILFTVNTLLIIGFAALACSPSLSRQMKTAWATTADLLRVIFRLYFGWLLFLTEVPWQKMRLSQSTSATSSRVLMGIGISLPFLLIFGLLFSSADLRFGSIFNTIFTSFLPMLYDQFWIAFWIFLACLGLFSASFLAGPTASPDYAPYKRAPALGIVESATALSLLAAMFLLFVVIQLPYLFGGQSQVSGTPGLQLSEYARRGFFELAWVATLLIPTLMLFMNITITETPRQKNLLNALCLGITILGGIIIVSALQRMLLYTANYGLTELRVYVSAFIILLACILVLLNVLNHIGRGRFFLPASLAVGVLFSVAIQTPNIQGIIANDIIRRHTSGQDGDMEYLKQLSADAVPAIIASPLPPNSKKDITQAIVSRETKWKHNIHWLYYSLSVHRAQRLTRDISAPPPS